MFSSFHSDLLCIIVAICCSLSTMPLPIPVLSSPHRLHKRLTLRGCCLSNLVVPARTTHVEFQVSGSLWNCRSAANKAEFISAYATLQ
ncbi:hypothetical protein J4Q44_G00237550, partial [Coregonus suidteri]